MVVRFKTENWAMMDDIVEYKGEKLQVMLTNATPEALLKGKKDNFNYVLTDGNKFLEVKDLTVPLKKK
jgi:hypothetical protein